MVVVEVSKHIFKILKKIPGFRSGEKINMIIGGIYYSINIVGIIMSFIYLSGLDRMNIIKALGGAILLPMWIFYFAEYMNNR